MFFECLLKPENETTPQNKEVAVCQISVVLDLAVVFVCDVYFIFVPLG